MKTIAIRTFLILLILVSTKDSFGQGSRLLVKEKVFYLNPNKIENQKIEIEWTFHDMPSGLRLTMDYVNISSNQGFMENTKDYEFSFIGPSGIELKDDNLEKLPKNVGLGRILYSSVMYAGVYNDGIYKLSFNSFHKGNEGDVVDIILGFEVSGEDFVFNLKTIFTENKQYYSEQGFLLGKEEITEDKIRIYPNPTKDFIQIDNYKGDITILNSLGQNVLNIKDYDDSKIDISLLPSGFYFIKLENMEIKKIVKI